MQVKGGVPNELWFVVREKHKGWEETVFGPYRTESSARVARKQLIMGKGEYAKITHIYQAKLKDVYRAQSCE